MTISCTSANQNLEEHVTRSFLLRSSSQIHCTRRYEVAVSNSKQLMIPDNVQRNAGAALVQYMRRD